jgi:putative glutamine amidotransferase
MPNVMRNTESPLILVTADVRESDGYVWHAALETYLTALTWIGAIPLILPSLGEAIDLESVIARVDGVLVTGSRSNVHPARYGVEPSERHEPYDHARDATSLRLIRLAVERGVPLFAICRGFQELNVALGGTLETEAQERPGSLDHRAAPDRPQDERFQLAHDVTFTDDSRLAELLGARCIRVNSLHRQAVDRLAVRLVVEARASDGTIEAVRVADARAFAYGVQWHPEYWVTTDVPSGALFHAFGKAARDRAARQMPIAAE